MLVVCVVCAGMCMCALCCMLFVEACVHVCGVVCECVLLCMCTHMLYVICGCMFAHVSFVGVYFAGRLFQLLGLT